MFSALDGPPKIVRLHGRGTLVTPEHSPFTELASHFPANSGTRAFVHDAVTRVVSSCGYAMPFLAFREHRETPDSWAANPGPEKMQAYRASNNQKSTGGLPAFGHDA
jgi:hypothetical protein